MSSSAVYGTSEAESETQRLANWVQSELTRLGTIPERVLLGVSGPRISLDRFLALDLDPEALLWDPPHAPGFAGFGFARALRVSGPTRFSEAARQSREWLEKTATLHRDRPGESLELCFGGFACFESANSTSDPAWGGWGDGLLVLPRILYKEHEEGTASYGIVCELSGHGSRAEAIERAAHKLIEIVRRASEPSLEPEPTACKVALVLKEDEERWVQLIEAITQAIAEGRFEKIVAARRVALELQAAPRWQSLVGRLGDPEARTTRFAFARLGSTFFGATPECLLDKRGARCSTEALAGSTRVGDEAARRLLESPKDLEEHAIVVREIVRSLSRFCDSVAADSKPHTRSLPFVTHLCTSIHGELKAPTHILELVSALHPTPAIGGVPKEEARRFIEAHERDRRGWYAGPIGWFDRHGDGFFAVALRSALLVDKQAHLYAGAGIVSGSDPKAEYQETELKLKGLLRVLGADA